METIERLLEVRACEADWRDEGYYLSVTCCADPTVEPSPDVILRTPLFLEIPDFDIREVLTKSLEEELENKDAKHQVQRNILVDKIQQLKALPAPDNT